MLLTRKVEALLKESRAAVDTVRGRLGIDKADNLSTLYGAKVLNAVYWHDLCDIPEVYDLCKKQEIVTPDGTTTVALIGYELLQQVFKEGISPKVICKILPQAAEKAIDLLTEMAVRVDVREDRKSLFQSTITAIKNRVDPDYMIFLAKIAVDAASFVDDPIQDIFFLHEYLGGKIDDTIFMEGYPFIQQCGVPRSESFSSCSSMRIALIDFDILPTRLRTHGFDPRLRTHGFDPIADEVTLCAHEFIVFLKDSGVNVVVIGTSRLVDFATMYAFKLIVDHGDIYVLEYAYGDVSVDFISKALNCRPIVTTDGFEYPSNFGQARSIEELKLGDYSFARIRGIKWNKDRGRIGTIIFRGSDFSADVLYQQYALNIALGNLATLFKEPYLIPGGGAPHIQLSIALSEMMDKNEKKIGTNNMLMEQVKCVKLFAKVLEVIPWTLARNVGLDPATTVTELKNDHKLGLINAGINTSKGHTSIDMLKEGVVHPLLLLTNAIKLATDFVCEQFKSPED